jgi:hypothetical protein
LFAASAFDLSCFSAADDKIHLRSEGRTLSLNSAKVMTVTRGFYHADWNAAGKGVRHQYKVEALQDALVVVDSTFGLMWQRGGSAPQLMDRQEAEEYVRSLNAQELGGFADWRLPTLEEAMSLMTAAEDGRLGESLYGDEVRKGVYHINPVFETSAAYFVWTADLESSQRGWVVYFWDGICTTEEVRFHAYVRAVRSHPPQKNAYYRKIH